MSRFVFLTALLLPLGPPGGYAAEDLTVTLDAGKHDRSQTPVCVPLSLPKEVATGQQPVVVAYRLWLQPGEMTGEEAQHLRDDLVEPVKETV